MHLVPLIIGSNLYMITLQKPLFNPRFKEEINLFVPNKQVIARK